MELVAVILSTFLRWLWGVLGQLFPFVPMAASLGSLQARGALLSGLCFGSDAVPQEKCAFLLLCLAFLPSTQVCLVL